MACTRHPAPPFCDTETAQRGVDVRSTPLDDLPGGAREANVKVAVTGAGYARILAANRMAEEVKAAEITVITRALTSKNPTFT
jgi:hypothetical protein